MENRNIYKGHRYVPKVMGVWDELKAYEGLSVVTWEGTSYTSKKHVPEGVEITNEEYWVVTGNYNAQVEQYRQDVRDFEDEINAKTPQTEFDDFVENTTTQLSQKANDSNFKDLGVNVKDYGAVGDGVHNDTEFIQNCLDNEKNVYFPEGHYLVSTAIGIDFKSDSNIHFINSKIVSTPSNLESYQITRFRGVKNINIHNLKVEGDRLTHSGTTGEWGMGISILSSKNINFYNVESTNCWGDSIYIGVSGDFNNEINENINFYGKTVVDHSRRQGVSVISATNSYIEHLIASNIRGTLPKSAIDFEPNGWSESISNFIVDKIDVYNCEAGVEGVASSGTYNFNIKELNTENVDKPVNISSYGNFNTGYNNVIKIDEINVLGTIDLSPIRFHRISRSTFPQIMLGDVFINLFSNQSDENGILKLTIGERETTSSDIVNVPSVTMGDVKVNVSNKSLKMIDISGVEGNKYNIGIFNLGEIKTSKGYLPVLSDFFDLNQLQFSFKMGDIVRLKSITNLSKLLENLPKNQINYVGEYDSFRDSNVGLPTVGRGIVNITTYVDMAIIVCFNQDSIYHYTYNYNDKTFSEIKDILNS